MLEIIWLMLFESYSLSHEIFNATCCTITRLYREAICGTCRLYFIICKIYFILIVEQADKFKDITHQHDVWHGGKNLAKKINAVCLHNL